jgi:hypothetical protein
MGPLILYKRITTFYQPKDDIIDFALVKRRYENITFQWTTALRSLALSPSSPRRNQCIITCSMAAVTVAIINVPPHWISCTAGLPVSDQSRFELLLQSRTHPTIPACHFLEVSHQ